MPFVGCNLRDAAIWFLLIGDVECFQYTDFGVIGCHGDTVVVRETGWLDPPAAGSAAGVEPGIQDLAVNDAVELGGMEALGW